MIHDLGQNFLVDTDVLEDIIATADLTADDVVLEIGAGRGVLTDALAKRVRQVVALELDGGLVTGLQERFKKKKNVEIVHADFLKWWGMVASGPAHFRERSFKVVANLPYGITSRALRVLLEHAPRPETITVMVQKEVAERVCAKPGDMSLLSLAVQWFGEPRIVRIVPPESFDPAPKVESAILHIEVYSEERLAKSNELTQDVFRLARIGFASRRKQLHNQLASALKLPSQDIQNILRSIGIAEKARAQELSIEHWKTLAQRISVRDIKK